MVSKGYAEDLLPDTAVDQRFATVSVTDFLDVLSVHWYPNADPDIPAWAFCNYTLFGEICAVA